MQIYTINAIHVAVNFGYTVYPGANLTVLLSSLGRNVTYFTQWTGESLCTCVWTTR